MSIFIVAFGGALGALIRFGILKLIAHFQLHVFVATTIANTLACLFFGLWFAMGYRSQHVANLFLFTGILGGLGTFSSYIADVLYHDGAVTAMLFLTIPLLLGFLAMILGHYLGHKFL